MTENAGLSAEERAAKEEADRAVQAERLAAAAAARRQTGSTPPAPGDAETGRETGERLENVAETPWREEDTDYGVAPGTGSNNDPDGDPDATGVRDGDGDGVPNV